MTNIANNTYPVITIDGPSGAGKGTLAYRLAAQTGFGLLDSGALYRIVGLLAHKANLLDDNAADLEEKLAALTERLQLDFVVNHQSKSVQIMVNGAVLTDDIRNETVGGYASKVAVFAKVRAALLAVQRDMATRGGVIADGRDMGTVVFPEATAKIYLTASSEARAKRRVAQLEAAGKAADFTAIFQEICDRDARDASRSVAPLKPADDALQMDSSMLNADEVYEQACAFIRSKGIEI